MSPGIDPAFATGAAGVPQIWDAVARWRSEGRSFALLTVIETRGFTPQKAGVHMIVDARGETIGTIGGGAIEHEALGRARALLTSRVGADVVKRHLTQELGMCCGGEMSVFVEVVEVAPALYLFGAGYIARPLALLASGCGFRVTVVDERPEWTDPDRFPGITVRCQAPEDFARANRFEPSDFAVVVTHDHALDQRLVQALLRQPLGYLGMIGSVPKQRKFALRLRARGFSDQEIVRLHTPLGVPIGARSPEEIAVSVMAELIAARRGVVVGQGWVPPGRASREQTGVGEETAKPSEEEKLEEPRR